MSSGHRCAAAAPTEPTGENQSPSWEVKTACLGMVILAVLFVLYSIGTVSDGTDNKSQPFEVVTKSGNVTLHLGMPKDSVILLVGEPYEFRSFSLGNRVIPKFRSTLV